MGLNGVVEAARNEIIHENDLLSNGKNSGRSNRAYSNTNSNNSFGQESSLYSRDGDNRNPPSIRDNLHNNNRGIISSSSEQDLLAEEDSQYSGYSNKNTISLIQQQKRKDTNF